MSYKISHTYQGPLIESFTISAQSSAEGIQQSKIPKATLDKATTLVITIENNKMKFPSLTYDILSAVKLLTFFYATLIGFANRSKLFSCYERFLEHGWNSDNSRAFREKDAIADDMSQFLLNGVLNFEQFMPLIYIAAVAQLCQMLVGSKIVRERLVIIQNLGVQLESETIKGSVARRFIDSGRVRDIVINEYLTQFDIGEYIAVIVEKEKSLIIPFKNCKLKLKELIPIYQAAKRLIGPSPGATFQSNSN
ncbi:hypothetical protein FGO68_gene868 [Halteria grandinella]|uniref:Phosphatidylinositol N-acetylglucosaminyltransferase subunit H conserved domain-containing protein n=1 Tax=Halteria grandinella TaxID=5974 RepID=A0A8J8NWU6_HALGN|nr:hypothetical protein FGO68_gene868 [Halteria grandinella]